MKIKKELSPPLYISISLAIKKDLQIASLIINLRYSSYLYLEQDLQVSALYHDSISFLCK